MTHPSLSGYHLISIRKCLCLLPLIVTHGCNTKLLQVVQAWPFQVTFTVAVQPTMLGRLYPVIATWQREFDDMRTRRTLVPTDREDAVGDHYTATLERDERARSALPGKVEIEAARAEAYARIENEDISGLDKLDVPERWP